MRQYVIDELRLSDFKKLETYLESHFNKGMLDGIFYLPLDSSLLTDVQKSHSACQPYQFCVELAEERISCELLVRSKKSMKCDCLAIATETQRNFLIKCLDDILTELNIIF